MLCTVKSVLAIANGEIGYKEKKSNSQLDDKTANAGSGNYTKYARDLANAGFFNGNKNGYDWCTIFVCWCFWMACGKDRVKAEKILCHAGDLAASCKYATQYYQKAGRFFKDARPGDQALFTRGHTGIVVSVGNGKISLIEGNCSNAVKATTYSYPNSQFSGFGRPKFETEATAPAPVISAEAKPVIKKGDVVRIIGTTYYSGKTVPGWVLAKKWIVLSASGDRVVVDKSTDGNSQICSPFHASDLEVVNPDGIDVGDVVKIVVPQYYSGKTVPGWVLAKNWIVLSAYGDRIVVDKSEDGKSSICSPFHRDALEIVKKK